MSGSRASPDAPPDRARELDRLARAMVADGSCSAVALSVADGAFAVGPFRAGRRRLADPAPVAAGDRFDLASLTKPFMAELARLLDGAGELSLDLPVGEVWEGADPRLADRSLRALLEHRAGFQAWAPLSLCAEGPTRVAELLLGGRLLGAPEGRYSDLDFILWGLTAERALGRPLARLVAERLEPAIGHPLLSGDHVVECGLDNRREVELAAEGGRDLPRAPAPAPGEPQDGNARFLGGIGGHAGLFASAVAVTALARRVVERGRGGPPGEEGGYALGWARPSTWRGGGAGIPAGGLGHLGFTGGSVWVDPGRGRIAVLLAHRASVERGIDRWRQRFHRLAFAGPTPSPDPAW
ncbi:MAG: serine hydrolase domain-containing protein [Thermoanaerobaculia bacterium]|nr:serine hydrolase domain-containing protein [Thermoanaerobaculia bacterium]